MLTYPATYSSVHCMECEEFIIPTDKLAEHEVKETPYRIWVSIGIIYTMLH